MERRGLKRIKGKEITERREVRSAVIRSDDCDVPK